MGSKHMETKEAQKGRYVAQLEARIDALKTDGIPEEKIKKDDKVKRFKSKIKQFEGAIARIGEIADKTKELKEKKEKAQAEAEAARLADIKGEAEKVKKGSKKKEPEPEKGKGKGKKGGQAKDGQAKGGQAKAGAKGKKTAKK